MVFASRFDFQLKRFHLVGANESYELNLASHRDGVEMQ